MTDDERQRHLLPTSPAFNSRPSGATRPAGPASSATTRPSRSRRRSLVAIEHTLARRGAERLWRLLTREGRHVAALGALTGGQAVQMVKATEAIYLSGWQVAADGNLAGSVYPDQSLYPANSVPAMVRRLNNALRRADLIEHAEGNVSRDWLAPIVADAEAGFRRPLNAFELMTGMIEAGGRGALRGSARRGEEVRAPRGARAHLAVHPHAERGALWTWPACRPCSSRAPTPTPPRC